MLRIRKGTSELLALTLLIMQKVFKQLNFCCCEVSAFQEAANTNLLYLAACPGEITRGGIADAISGSGITA